MRDEEDVDDCCNSHGCGMTGQRVIGVDMVERVSL